MINTRQELVDAIRAAQEKQNWMRASNDDNGCKYRLVLEDETVLKCAIGCLIPDDKYNPEFEEKAFYGKCVMPEWTNRIMEAAGVNPELFDALSEMQEAHDNQFKTTWKSIPRPYWKNSFEALVLEWGCK